MLNILQYVNNVDLIHEMYTKVNVTLPSSTGMLRRKLIDSEEEFLHFLHYLIFSKYFYNVARGKTWQFSDY